MLTVRYDRLGLGPGDVLLDLGTGGGRHAFEAMRRGAAVVAVDADREELTSAGGMMAALVAEDPATQAAAGAGAGVQADAVRLPFGDGAFDRVIAAEVLEHIPDDRAAIAELARVLRQGGTMAVTVPRWYPEAVNWRLSSAYHDRPGGHVRIYRRSELVGRLADAGLQLYAAHYAHALHSPYWWLRCAVGVDNDGHPAVRAYHRLLVWDITRRPRLTRLPEAVLNPLLGKSTVVYVKKTR